MSRHPTKLVLSVKERNSLKSLMDSTNDKKEYRRVQAVLQKADGRTYRRVHSPGTQSQFKDSQAMDP